MQILTLTLLLLLAAAIGSTTVVVAAPGSQQLRVSEEATQQAGAPSDEFLPKHHHEQLRHRALNPVSRLCLAGIPTLCLCTEDALRSAVLAASRDRSTVRPRPSIRICSGTEINITSPIDITGKTFSLGCGPVPISGYCGLVGSNTTQLLTGAPVDVQVRGLSFRRGRAGITTDGNGGAIAITGGKFTVEYSQFLSNRADKGKGAGLYATGSGTKITIKSSRFYGNRAANGGGLYIENGAKIEIVKTAFLSNNATTSGGAMGFSNANALLKSQTIAGNSANVMGSADIFIGGDGAGFVDCTLDGLFPNLFCDGLEGIADGGSTANTNCAANGEMSGPRCRLT